MQPSFTTPPAAMALLTYLLRISRNETPLWSVELRGAGARARGGPACRGPAGDAFEIGNAPLEELQRNTLGVDSILFNHRSFQ